MKRVLMFFFLLTTAIFAEVKTQLSAEKLLPDGEIIVAESATPGETVIYTYTMKNTDSKSVKNLNPSLKVPHGTTLLPAKITTPNFKVSLDEVEFLPYPIKDKEGNPVDESLYRAVSWNIAELKGDEERAVKLGVQINGPQ